MEKGFTPKPGRLMDLGFGILRRSTDYILIVEVKETLRFYHYAYSTEKSYVQWILRYIRFNDRRHPKDMGKTEIERFLSHLAINRNVSAATQNQALNAILFLYKSVLKSPIEADIRANRASKGRKRPIQRITEYSRTKCTYGYGSTPRRSTINWILSFRKSV